MPSRRAATLLTSEGGGRDSEIAQEAEEVRQQQQQQRGVRDVLGASGLSSMAAALSSQSSAEQSGTMKPQDDLADDARIGKQTTTLNKRVGQKKSNENNFIKSNTETSAKHDKPSTCDGTKNKSDIVIPFPDEANGDNSSSNKNDHKKNSHNHHNNNYNNSSTYSSNINSNSSNSNNNNSNSNNNSSSSNSYSSSNNHCIKGESNPSHGGRQARRSQRKRQPRGSSNENLQQASVEESLKQASAEAVHEDNAPASENVVVAANGSDKDKHNPPSAAKRAKTTVEPKVDPEEGINDEMSEVLNKLRAGLLVWVKQKKYPWWPAMVTYHPTLGEIIERHPDTNQFKRLHVQFFGTKLTRAYIRGRKNFTLFHPDVAPPPGEVPKGRAVENYDTALSQAKVAARLSTAERLFQWGCTFETPGERAKRMRETAEQARAAAAAVETTGGTREVWITPKDPHKPKRPITSYFAFVQEMRPELKKDFPGLSLTEQAKKLGGMWKSTTDAERERFNEISKKDTVRYKDEMKKYVPPAKVLVRQTPSKPKPEKDENRPSRYLSSFFHFLASSRETYKAEHPDLPMTEVVQHLSTRWKAMSPEERQPFDALAEAGKVKYDAEMETYRKEKKQQQEEEKERKKSLKRKEKEAALEAGGEAVKDVVGDADAPPSTKKAKQKKKVESDACFICEDLGHLIVCDDCPSAFHPECIGLACVPEGSFRCDACVSGNVICSFCDESCTGQPVLKCTHRGCAHQYHEFCARRLPRAKFETPDTALESLASFVCPLHICATCDVRADSKLVRCVRCSVAYHEGCVPASCAVNDLNLTVCPRHNPVVPHANSNCCLLCGNGGALVCCDGCPAAYHVECVQTALGFWDIPDEGHWFCPECVGGIKPIPNDIVWIKAGNHRWWPGKIHSADAIAPCLEGKPHKPGEFAVQFFGSKEWLWMDNSRVVAWSTNDHKGRFSQGSKKPVFLQAIAEAAAAHEAVTAERKLYVDSLRDRSKQRPAAFRRIARNLYTIPKPSKVEAPQCSCDPKLSTCGEDCLNRMMYYECSPSNCPSGDKCENCKIQKRQYPHLIPIKTESRGWGLKSDGDIAPGDFVIEYVGEIIDPAELERRLAHQAKIGVTSYYMMSIDNDNIIDARLKANMARFINHSCDPNCYTQKWNVNGETRVGIFAKRFIPAGEELTFDYQLDCLGNIEKKRCNCGASNCSGFIGVKPQRHRPAESASTDTSAKKSKGKRKSEGGKPRGRKPSKLSKKSSLEDATDTAAVKAKKAVGKKRKAPSARPHVCKSSAKSPKKSAKSPKKELPQPLTVGRPGKTTKGKRRSTR